MPLDKIISNVQGNPAITGALSGAAGGALVSAFTNRKSARGLLKTGGLLALGGVAWHAYQSYKGAQAEADVSSAPGQPLPELQKQDFEKLAVENAPDALVVVDAMIAAAHADGTLDDQERSQIWQRALAQGLSAADLASLTDRISNPKSLQEIASAASTMELKIEVYTASLLVLDKDMEQNELYLKALSGALALPVGLILALESQVVAGEQAA